MNETLEKNLFFNTLITKYSKLYDAASSDCCLFVVPRNKYLKNININEKFFFNHIFKPSPLLKQHYLPYKKCSIIDIEIEDNFLIVQKENENLTEKIDLIGEETAYNNNKKNKILLIDRPLLKIKVESNLLEEISLTVFFTFEECQNYLTALSPIIIKDIKVDLNNFLKSYLFLPNYLEDAASKLKEIIDSAFIKYMTGNVSSFDEEILISSLECYIIGLSFKKLYSITEKQYNEDDEIVKKQLKKLKNENITLSNLGCNKIFDTYQPSKQIYDYFENLFLKKTPLEKIFLCKKILEKINEELNEFINIKCFSPFTKNNYEIITDDLVAIVVYIIIEFSTKNNFNVNLISEFKYIQIFNFYLQNKNEYGYSFVTFEVAIGFIKEYKFKKEENCSSSNKSTGSFKKLSSKNSQLSNSKLISLNKNKPKVCKQLSFNSMKFDDDLEQITKLIEETSFSFQKLRNTEDVNTENTANINTEIAENIKTENTEDINTDYNNTKNINVEDINFKDLRIKDLNTEDLIAQDIYIKEI